MEINVIEKKKNKILFELVGEDHTICNALRQELTYDSAVKAAGYNVSHPLTANPQIIVETSTSKTPIKALQDAVKRLKKSNEKFLKDMKKK